MRIVYYSHWGTYAAYTMASLHTGLYPKDRLPSVNVVKAQYELCHRYAEQAGNLIYVGMDDRFREVYSLGCKRHGGMMVRAIQNISDIFTIQEPVRLISVEALEGRLPALIQYFGFYSETWKPKLFEIWFRRSYQKCLDEIERNTTEDREGIGK